MVRPCDCRARARTCGREEAAATPTVEGDGGGAGDRRPIAARGSRGANALAGWLIARRASPDAISLAGMGCGLAAGACLAGVWWAGPGWGSRALWLLAALLVQGRLLCNLLDGMVAVGRGVASATGELFNEVPDRVSDAAVLVGLGAAAGGDWALGWAAALAAMATAYARAVGRGLGRPSDFRGPMAKQHRMAAVTAVAVWCGLAPWAWGAGSGLPALALWAILVLSLATAARRLAGVASGLRASGGGRAR